MLDPLNLENILINHLAGSYLVFIGLALITIAVMAAFFRMTTGIMLIMITLFGLIMYPWIGDWMLLIIVLIGAVITGFLLSKIWKQ